MSYAPIHIDVIEDWCRRALAAIPELIEAYKEELIAERMKEPTTFLRRLRTREQAIKSLRSEDWGQWHFVSSHYSSSVDTAARLLQLVAAMKEAGDGEFLWVSAADIERLAVIAPMTVNG